MGYAGTAPAALDAASRQAQTRARLRWETLDIAFQPIVDIHSGRLFGVEALLRNTSSLGFESPTDFFDECHTAGHLFTAELFTLSKAFEKFVRLPDHQKLKLFVNLDGRNVAAGAMGPRLAMLRDQYGLTNSHIALEVSERYDFSRSQSALDALLELKTRFGSLTLDDFGSGHANLQLFYHVEPSIVKLDRFIISSVGSDPKKSVFLQHVVRMAHFLGSVVIAEGVETAREHYVCRELGCDLVQGYGVAKPETNTAEVRNSYAGVGILRTQDRRRETDLSLIEGLMDTVEPIPISHSIHEVFDRFMKDRDRIFFPVVDDIGFPVGLIHERDLKGIVYSMYGRDLLKNRRRSANSISAFVKPCSVANINSSAEKIIALFNNVPDSDGVLIVKESRYGGFLHARSLLRILNEKNLQIARDQNPLSRLPGNILIQEYLAAAAGSEGDSHHFVYLDFDYFKPFNDAYGFRTGDRAILMCADILRTEFSGEGRFVGHIGGDDFFVGLQNVSHEAAMKEVRRAVQKFNTDVESLYSADHRRNGYIVGSSRSGKREKFPLLSISGAVIYRPRRKALPGLDELSVLIASAKKAAKTSQERIAVVELG